MSDDNILSKIDSLISQITTDELIRHLERDKVEEDDWEIVFNELLKTTSKYNIQLKKLIKNLRNLKNSKNYLIFCQPNIFNEVKQIADHFKIECYSSGFLTGIDLICLVEKQRYI